MKLVVGLLVGFLVLSVSADVTLSGIFTDHMVLQRGREVPVWGRAEPGETVTVRFDGQQVSAIADAGGDWLVRLKPLMACAEGRSLTVSASSSRTLCDVLVGDVWLVSGQSNAEYRFGRGVIGGEADRSRAKDYPSIRVVKFLHERALLPEKTVVCGGWVVADSNAWDNITAEGYYMARELNSRTGVPIGILDNNWGGCRIEPYLSLEAMAGVPGLEEMYAKAKDQAYRLSSDYWRKQVVDAQDAFLSWGRRIESRRAAGEETLNMPSIWHPFNSELCGQYNAMIEPIVRFPIVGATWYQGCSNAGDGEGYLPKLKALVSCWRKAWGYEFPFYIVQLAAYGKKTDEPAGGNGFAAIRNAQLKGFRTISKSGLAVAIDIGDAEDIHPKNKYDIGYRLSLWARRDVYGEKNLVVSGPLYREMTVEGNRLRVEFDFVGGGLMSADRKPNTRGESPVPTANGRLRGFSIAGADKVWHSAEAFIDGGSVVVFSESVSKPVAVRYAYRGNPMGDCNLYNREGLPASPFRSDCW